MPWGAVGAVVGGVVAAEGSKSAAKENREGQENAAAIVADSADQAREDLYTIFPNAQATSTAGFQGAFDAIGAAAPQQVAALLQGNQQAQGVIGQGAQQYQNAILGLGTDTSYLQPQQIDYDSSWMQDIVPELRAPENRFGEAAGVVGSPVFNQESDAAIANDLGVGTEAGDAAAAEAAAERARPAFLEGINTNEQLWAAISNGVIPGVSDSDAAWFGALLSESRGKADQEEGQFPGQASAQRSTLADNAWLTNPDFVRESILGVPGGLDTANEGKVRRVLDAIFQSGSTYKVPLGSELLRGF
jgi:hypothetical protein